MPQESLCRLLGDTTGRADGEVCQERTAPSLMEGGSAQLRTEKLLLKGNRHHLLPSWNRDVFCILREIWTQNAVVEEETSPKFRSPSTYVQSFAVSPFCLGGQAEGFGGHWFQMYQVCTLLMWFNKTLKTSGKIGVITPRVVPNVYSSSCKPLRKTLRREVASGVIAHRPASRGSRPRSTPARPGSGNPRDCSWAVPTTLPSKSKGPYCSQRSNQLREFLVGGSLSSLPGRGLACILTCSPGFGGRLQVSSLFIFVRASDPSFRKIRNSCLTRH